MTEHKVRKLDERDIPTGKKLKLGLVQVDDQGDEEIVFEEWVSFSTWQLNDGGIEDRMQQWGERRCQCVEEDDQVPDDGTEVSLN